MCYYITIMKLVVERFDCSGWIPEVEVPALEFDVSDARVAEEGLR